MDGDEAPKNDEFHDEFGRHRLDPPEGYDSPTWHRRLRLHVEGHKTEKMIGSLTERFRSLF